jgi:type I restriction enzyme S subunit
MAGEETVQLRDVCLKIGSGATPRGGREAYKGGATSLIRSQNIYNEGFRRDGLVYIDDKQSAELRNVEVRPNDVLLNITGDSVARCCQVAEDVLPARVNQHVAIIRPEPKSLDARFLRYVLVSDEYQSRMLALASAGATRPALTKSMIEELDIPSPPLVEQQSIAAVLGALDDKIELNRRMNATLEAMARALFQSWFVDFDPARAKLDGRTPAALDPTTAALFPDSFQDSPIGPVPKGWKVERFDAHITADRGLSYNGEGLRNDGTGLPMHNLNSIYEGGGYKHEGIKYYQGEYREKHLVEAGDMIVTNTEQGFDRLLIGHAAIVPRCFGPKGIFSHHIYRVRFKPSSPFNPHYLVELFNNRRWHYWISGFSNGTTINMLPIDALEMPLFVVPPKELVMTFTAIAQAARDQIENIIQQSRALATLRNTLLPKLLSGELSVTNAARKES